MYNLDFFGFFILQTPALNIMPSLKKGKKNENSPFLLPVFTSSEEDESISYVPTISPNTFRARLRDLCGLAVWKHLPPDKRGFYTARVLFAGGIPLSKKPEGKNAKKFLKELKTFNRSQNLYIDLWGGGTGKDYYDLIPSRLLVSILPLYKEIYETICGFDPAENFCLIPDTFKFIRNQLQEKDCSTKLFCNLYSRIFRAISNAPSSNFIKKLDWVFMAGNITKQADVGQDIVSSAEKEILKTLEIIGDDPEFIYEEEEKKETTTKSSKKRKPLKKEYKLALRSVFGTPIERCFIPPQIPFLFQIRGINLLPEQVGLFLLGFKEFTNNPRLGGGRNLNCGLTAGIACAELKNTQNEKPSLFFNPEEDNSEKSYLLFAWDGLNRTSAAFPFSGQKNWQEIQEKTFSLLKDTKRLQSSLFTSVCFDRLKENLENFVKEAEEKEAE